MLLHVSFSLVTVEGATLFCSVQASHCGGLFYCVAWTLEHGLSGCGTWAWTLHGMWNLPRPGIELVSPALAGRFVTVGSPEKSHVNSFYLLLNLYVRVCFLILCIFETQLNIQFSSVIQLCPTLCNPMDCSTPGFPVHHQLTPRACSNSCLSSW